MTRLRKPEREMLTFIENIVRFRNPPEGFIFSGPHDLVRRHGVFCQPTKKPREIEWGEWQLCYMNAYRLADGNPDLTYVEGFATAMFPVAHAWVVTPEGRVIDNTWRDAGESKVSLRHRAYIGIPLKIEYVKKIIAARGVYGVLEAYELDWPLMTGKDALSDVTENVPGLQCAEPVSG